MASNNSAVIAPRINATDLQGAIRAFWSSSRIWLEHHWVEILIALAAGALLVIVFHALRNLGDRLCARDSSTAGWGTVIGRAISKTNNFFIVTLAAKLVDGYAGAPGNVASTIDFLFTVAAVFQAAIWAREIILGAIQHRTSSETYSGEALLSAMGLIRVLVSFALFAIAFIVVLDNLGVNVTGLVAGLGVGGIAIGLAAQGIFADLFAALAIIFDKPFRRGDAVSYDSTDGSVEAIGLKSVRIRGINGEERIISNKNLLDKEIINNTKRERRRTRFAIGLAYETPVETLEAMPATMKALVEENALVFVRCGFIGFGDSALDFQLEFDSPSPDFQTSYDARHKMGIAILKMCNERGITIPFPIQTTYTAAPDGTLVLPYTEPRTVKAAGEEVAGAS